MTLQQIEAITKIISDHIEVIKKLLIGRGEPSPQIMARLKINKETADLITTAFKYGKITAVKNNLTITEITKLIKKTALTVNQAKALEYIKTAVGQHIVVLGAKISGGVIPSLVNADLSLLQGIRAIVANGVINLGSQYSVVQGLRDLTNDWDRDWHRVAHTEMWNAKINGKVMAVIEETANKNETQEDIMVFKRPSPMACNQCKKLYLEDDGKKPKLFKLSDMMDYGTNVGLKVEEWKPVVGTVHPNCMCDLSFMPKYGKFDESGDIVFNRSLGNVK